MNVDEEKRDVFFSALNFSLVKGDPPDVAINDALMCLIAIYYDEHPDHPNNQDGN